VPLPNNLPFYFLDTQSLNSCKRVGQANKGEEGNVYGKRREFLHVDCGKQEERRVMGRAPTMLGLKATIIGLCLCWKCGPCACKNGLCPCGAFSC
jgi:hypothetical protein